MKIYQALAQAFQRKGVTTCFALLGDANMHWAGALSELGTEMIYTRHEHAAVAGATAYARCSGRVGCATVTCGPGLTQVMTILPIAARARVPLVVFAGEAPLKKPWYNQGIEQAPFVEACGAIYQSAHDPATMVDAVHAAFATAKRERMPVVLGVPFDLQQDDYTSATELPTSDTLFEAPPVVEPKSDHIAEAAQWIAESERPIVLGGLGAVTTEARAALVALAEKAGALLATTLPAKGLFYDQPFCLGVSGGFATERSRAIFHDADLVIAVGSRLATHAFDGGKLTPNARVIHVDIAPQEVVHGRKAADLLVQADATLGAQALAAAISEQQKWRTPEMEARTRHALDLPDDETSPDGLFHPMAVVKALSQLIPARCHVVNTSGHCAYYTAQMNNHPQDHYTVIREFGAIGNGTSFALGVAAAFPDRPVVLIEGDGSSMMHVQELETMKRHNLHVLTIVLNDGAYGSEVHKLKADGVTLDGSVFGRPDLAAVGRGFGLLGRTITSVDDFRPALEEFLASKSPAIWDVHISDQVASPQILRAHRSAHAPTSSGAQ